MCVCDQLFATLWTIACGPLSMAMKPRSLTSPALAGRLFTDATLGKPMEKPKQKKKQKVLELQL